MYEYDMQYVFEWGETESLGEIIQVELRPDFIPDWSPLTQPLALSLR